MARPTLLPEDTALRTPVADAVNVAIYLDYDASTTQVLPSDSSP